MAGARTKQPRDKLRTSIKGDVADNLPGSATSACSLADSLGASPHLALDLSPGSRGARRHLIEP
jgi:hypothetical protein